MTLLQLTYSRLVVVVLSGFLLGMLMLDLRFDAWYIGSFAGYKEDPQLIQTALRYYHHVDSNWFIPRVIDLTIAIVGTCGVYLLSSHRYPETPTHIHGSTSRTSDLVNILLFVVGAPYFVLVVQPALAAVTKAVAATPSGKEVAVPEGLKDNLTVVAQGHFVLVGIVSTVLFMSVMFMKKVGVKDD